MTELKYIVDQVRKISDIYDEEWRKYHNNDHISTLFDLLDIYAGVFNLNEDEAGILSDAILFHDTVYNIPSEPLENETKSAEFYVEEMKSVSEEIDQEVIDIIIATGHHFDGTVYEDTLTNIMLDLDIISFAFEYEDFVETNKDIDEEYYAFLPKEDVDAGRAKFLRDILENKKLMFRILPQKDLLEMRAYSNIQRYLEENYGA